MTSSRAPRTLAGAVPALVAQQLGFQYVTPRRGSQEGSAGWAIQGVDLTVYQGELLGIIGPNGSGKSSLLKLLAQLARPHCGSIQLFGQPLVQFSRGELARQVAYVAQDLAGEVSCSVLELVLMGRFAHQRERGWTLLGWEARPDIVAAEEAMAQTQVAHLATRRIQSLSAGERQRVLLARALAQRPRVLLLDEPTAHLDLQHQLAFCQILQSVRAHSQMTVVWVSHDINLAIHSCDRMVVMHAGAVRYSGMPIEVITPDVMRTVYGCDVVVDVHPRTGLPCVSLPATLPSVLTLGGRG